MKNPRVRNYPASYSTPVDTNEILEFSLGEMLATVELNQSNTGWTSEWWVSRLNTETAQAAGFLVIPVFGGSREVALRRVSHISTDVLELIEQASGGVAPAVSSGDRTKHIAHHLEAFIGLLDPEGEVVTNTALMYEFLETFQTPAPAKLIAEVLGMDSVRTIQDRLDRARDRGLLARPGRGKNWTG